MRSNRLAVVAALALAFSSAWAGDILLGTILVTDAGTGTNFTAGATKAAPTVFISGTRCNVGFDLPMNYSVRDLRIQTDEACFVLNDVSGCDAGQCIQLAANVLTPISIIASRTLSANAWNWDGGSQATPCVVTRDGGWIAVAPPNGGAACHAKVFVHTDP